MTPADKIKKSAAMAAYDYMAKDPEKNIPNLLGKLIELDSEGLGLRRQVENIRNTFLDPNSSTRQEVLSFFHDVDDHQRRKLYETIVVNGSLIGTPIQKRNRVKYGCNIPWTILVDPTSACNLKCTGCWAAEYGHTLSLTLDELESIIQQANELGCYEFLFAGGEPMMRREDIITLCRRHQDCGFMMFTNGTLIDESFADELLEVGNLVPAISVEGYEKETDFRRGQGTFQRVMKAMEIMKRRKLIFGASCCYTRKNVELIGSDEYFDTVVSWGAKFMWCFSYTPIGKGADTSLMVTPEQRKYMYYNIRRLRSTKPLFAMDFYNDAKYVHGCIAGGRSYLHINANGDIEPCAFNHFSDANIRTDTLLEALQKPLFMAYHDNQPFNDNMLRPCPLVDNPGRLTLMVNQTGARSTEIIEPDNAEELTSRCVEFAKGWAPIARDLWDKEQASETGKMKPD
jgi:MoaA/NifB/PqqE/SkfB family radical SAM enzyme